MAEFEKLLGEYWPAIAMFGTVLVGGIAFLNNLFELKKRKREAEVQDAETDAKVHPIQIATAAEVRRFGRPISYAINFPLILSLLVVAGVAVAAAVGVIAILNLGRVDPQPSGQLPLPASPQFAKVSPRDGDLPPVKPASFSAPSPLEAGQSLERVDVRRPQLISVAPRNGADMADFGPAQIANLWLLSLDKVRPRDSVVLVHSELYRDILSAYSDYPMWIYERRFPVEEDRVVRIFSRMLANVRSDTGQVRKRHCYLFNDYHREPREDDLNARDAVPAAIYLCRTRFEAGDQDEITIVVRDQQADAWRVLAYRIGRIKEDQYQDLKRQNRIAPGSVD